MSQERLKVILGHLQCKPKENIVSFKLNKLLECKSCAIL